MSSPDRATAAPVPPARPADGYAGDLTPEQAWTLLQNDPSAVLVDVRTDAEWRFVGVPDQSSTGREPVLTQWVDVAGRPNPSFVADLRAAGVTPERPVVFLCRSGARSIGAAKAATAAGLGPAYNVLEGFEGALDTAGHRGADGWRAAGLPWTQS
ncbi:rhodanese-like domain-containing protein [Oerskovia sp. Sa1BUA8]|uniref:Rhodanese-like domain-containing protein n=1 Tax=Oerskovia douganii TaxID=2762210 RepID=A0A9D5Z0P0_9CELL|nr:rhodanese-like domain-containing protein [Oerskovia douganii]MBE7701696.1 rhodanese-like domain-containing protein [Oerskovia douganii]